MQPKLLAATFGSLLLACSATASASIRFTSDPPTGTVQGPGPHVVHFWLGDSHSGNQTIDLETGVGVGVTGDMVVAGMKSELDAFGGPFGGANAVLDGNTLTVANANSAWELSPPQVGLSWHKIPTGGFPGPLNVPMGAVQRPDEWILVLVVQDLVDPSRPAGTSGSIGMILDISDPADPITVSVPFSPTDTPQMILTNMDIALRGLTLPPGVVYDGLTAGPDAPFPTFLMDDEFEIAMDVHVSSADPVGFHVGALVAAPVPEPAGAGAVLGLALAGLRRRTRRV